MPHKSGKSSYKGSKGHPAKPMHKMPGGHMMAGKKHPAAAKRKSR